MTLGHKQETRSVGGALPEKPNLKVLDRDFSRAGALEVIEMACPILREVVNHATNVYLRCQHAPFSDLGEVDEDAAPFSLYHMVMEMTDGLEELLSQSCVVPAMPVLRASFEAGLGLDYVLQKDAKVRSLCWMYVYAEKKLARIRCCWGRENGAKFSMPTRRSSANCHSSPLTSTVPWRECYPF